VRVSFCLVDMLMFIKGFLPPIWSALSPYQPSQSKQALGLSSAVPPQMMWYSLSTVAWG
jgi:hypothetical protein